MLENLRFWFRRGIDGFRVDVSYRVMKDPQFRDNPPNPHWQPGSDPSKQVSETYTKNTPDIPIFNRWLREVADEFADRVLIGEINLPLPQLVKHYGAGNEFHLPFNFQLIFSDWTPQAVRHLAEEYEALLPKGAWPNWVLGNHDQHRVASRVGAAQARVAMTLLLTLRGTPTLYYGDEIGLEDVEIPPQRVQDPWEKFVPGIGLGRDPERTPMPWDATPNAGFCPPGVEPWLPLNADYVQRNVTAQQTQPDSMLAMTQQLIALRRRHPALHAGDFAALDAPEGVLAYTRALGDDGILVVLNFTGKDKAWDLPAEWGNGRFLFSTTMQRGRGVENGRLILRPNEGLLLQK